MVSAKLLRSCKPNSLYNAAKLPVYERRYLTSNVTGRHRGLKQKLWAGVAWAGHFCKFCCLLVRGTPW